MASDGQTLDTRRADDHSLLSPPWRCCRLCNLRSRRRSAFDIGRLLSVELSSATLQEIPDQLVSFFQQKGIQPGTQSQVSEGEIVVEEEDEIDLSLDFNEEEIVISAGGDDFGNW